MPYRFDVIDQRSFDQAELLVGIGFVSDSHGVVLDNDGPGGRWSDLSRLFDSTKTFEKSFTQSSA